MPGSDPELGEQAVTNEPTSFEHTLADRESVPPGPDDHRATGAPDQSGEPTRRDVLEHPVDVIPHSLRDHRVLGRLGRDPHQRQAMYFRELLQLRRSPARDVVWWKVV